MEEFKPSIVILKTGEQIICELKEVFDGESENKKGICLLMIHPFKLDLVNNFSENSSTPTDVQVKFSKWCPYSTDIQFKIPYDSVMAIGASDPDLAQAYQFKVSQIVEAENKNSTSQVIEPEVMSNE